MNARDNPHDAALLDAEVRHLVGVLEQQGILYRDAFAEAAGATHWHEGTFDLALARAVKLGALEHLPGDFYRVARADDGASEPS
jgi:hypothetical protein